MFTNERTTPSSETTSSGGSPSRTMIQEVRSIRSDSPDFMRNRTWLDMFKVRASSCRDLLLHYYEML